MRTAAIDPGTIKSGWVVVEDGAIVESSVIKNNALFDRLQIQDFDLLLIEAMVVHKANRTITETLMWSGIFAGCARQMGRNVQLVYRPDIRTHFLGKTRSAGSDGRIRSCLIQRYGEPGTKAKPGATYGVTSHAWQALAVVTAYHENVRLRTRQNQFNETK